MNYMVIDALEGRRNLAGRTKSELKVYADQADKLGDAVRFVITSTGVTSERAEASLRTLRSESAKLRRWLEGSGDNPNEISTTITTMDGQINGLLQQYFPGTIKPSVATLVLSAVGGIAVGLALTKMRNILG